MFVMQSVGALPMAREVGEIDPVFNEMLAKPLPGFQISPEVSTQGSLRALQKLMQVYNPDFEFDDIYGQEDIYTTHAHLDGGYSGRMAGVVLHENTLGLGSVTLQLVKPHVADTAQIRKNSFIEPCLIGELEPGMKTVFSNRIYDLQTKKVLLGASFHLFAATEENGSRSWKRYASSQVLGV